MASRKDNRRRAPFIRIAWRTWSMSYADWICLIRRHIATLRPQRLAAQGMMASKGVYITHEEVDALLDQKGRTTPSRRRWPPIALTRSLLAKSPPVPNGEFSCRCPG